MSLLTVGRIRNDDQLVSHRKINVLDIGVIVFLWISNTGSQFEKELVHVQVKQIGDTLTDCTENIELADW